MNARGFAKVSKPHGISADDVYVNSADVDELVPHELWDPHRSGKYKTMYNHRVL